MLFVRHMVQKMIQGNANRTDPGDTGHGHDEGTYAFGALDYLKASMQTMACMPWCSVSPATLLTVSRRTAAMASGIRKDVYKRQELDQLQANSNQAMSMGEMTM